MPLRQAFSLSPQLKPIKDQHELLASVLRQAGGKDAERLAPDDYRGKIADVVFPDDRLVVEVKSLTENRASRPTTKAKLGSIITEHGPRFGGPIAYGRVRISTNQLPPPLAERVLREVGDRVRKEVRAGDEQIAATAKSLGWNPYTGILGIISPPSVMRPDLIGWLLNDTLRPGRYPGINAVLIAVTPLLSDDDLRAASFLTFHGREGFDVGLNLRRRCAAAWIRSTGTRPTTLGAEEYWAEASKPDPFASEEAAV